MMRGATLWAASGAGVALSSAAAVALWLGPREVFGSQVAQSQFTAWCAMTVAMAVVVLAPAAGVLATLRARRIARLQVWPVVVARQGVGGQVLLSIALFATGATGGMAVLHMAIPSGAPSAVPELLMLWVTVVLLGCLGAVVATVIDEPLDAGAVAVVLSVTSASGWLVLGPLLERAPMIATMAALALSPVVSLSAAGSVDIFHVEPIYQLSPLAHGQASYPSAGLVGVAYVTVAVALGVAAVWRLNRPEEFSSRKDIA